MESTIITFAINASTMIRTKIKIGDGEILDTFESFGLCYLTSDKIMSAPSKTMESTTYPEREGENILPLAVDDAFDYKITFLVQSKNGLSRANALIEAFNNSLYSRAEGEDVKEYRQVTFYNPARNNTIVGYPKPISAATDYWFDMDGNESDAAKVEFVIRVNKPSLCDFSNCAI